MPFQAKSVLNEPSERKRYDLWLDSGIAMTFRQWQGLKDAVHTSMHWATPKLAGRMLDNNFQRRGEMRRRGVRTLYCLFPYTVCEVPIIF